MRKIMFFIMFIISVSSSALIIKDMAGREVDIPDNIERILPYDSKVSILLFSLASEKMIARAMLPGSETFQYISEEYCQKPEVDIKNTEEVLSIGPQVIIGGTYIGKEGFEKFNELHDRTGIPVVVIDLSIDRLDDIYLFLGSLLGKEANAKELAGYLQQVYHKIEELHRNSSQSEASVYYTIGKSGLMTDPSGSRHTELLDYMKINNVAKVRVPTGGHVNVNMEQVLVWNPDYIFCAGYKADINAYNVITTDSRWKSISAIRNNKVFKIPSQPFGWFDHPPSVNRIPGLIWLAQLFYELDKPTAQEMITDFYRLFYKYELSEIEYKSLF